MLSQAKGVFARAVSHLNSRIYIFSLSAVLASMPVITQAAVGSIPGSFSVSPSGAATYTIPIQVPPGIGGVKPDISLKYSSQSGNGLLGVGWSLGGLSSISRCPTTLAQDGFIDGVDFDANDRFCLDGQRLVEVAGNNCAGGTEYRTEIESYSRICSFGQAGSGPAYFEVSTRSGTRMEFGNTADAFLNPPLENGTGQSSALSWLLNKVTDAVGNYMTITYFEDGSTGESYPLRVDYAGNAGQGLAPHNSVEFNYQSGSDIPVRYTAGLKLTTTKKLASITTKEGVNVVKEYSLTYQPEVGTGRSQITSIQECDTAADCSSASQFQWSGVAPSFDTAQQILVSGSASGAPSYSSKGAHNWLVDVDGDGRTDYMWIPKGRVDVWVAKSTENGFLAPQPWLSANAGGGSPSYSSEGIHTWTVDVNGDGLTDYMWIPKGRTDVWVAKSTGNGFAAPQIWLSANAGGGFPSYSSQGAHTWIVDADGDGLTDYMWIPKGRIDVWVAKSTGNGFAAPQIWLPAKSAGGFQSYSSSGAHTWVVDVNADGLLDYMWIPKGRTDVWVAKSTGDSFLTPQVWLPVNSASGAPSYSAQGQHTKTIDVNGDGLTDYMWIPYGRTDYWVAQSTGSGFTVPQLWLPANAGGGFPSYSADGARTWLADLNGDGLTDYIWIPKGRVDVWVANSTGSSFSTPKIWIPTNAASGAPSYSGSVRLTWVADINADGAPDYMWIPNGRTDIWVANTLGAPFGVMSKITTGIGATSSFTLNPLTDASVYTKGTGSNYPERDFQAPLYVVDSVSNSDGLNGTRSSSYHYEGLKINLQGRGMLGFRTTQITDNETSIISTTTYNQDFPLTGRPESSDTRILGSPNPLSTSTATWNVLSMDGGTRYEVQAATSTEQSYELDGSLVKTVLTSNDSYGNYGEVTQITVTTTGGGETFTTQTNNVYAPADTANWILGRLTQADVTKTTPSGFDTRTSTFEYRADGLLSAEIIEPGDPNLMLRKDYTYDGYGNKTSVTVTDSGAGAEYPIATSPSTTSNTSYNYANLSVDGTYTTTSTNAKGHSETKVIDAAYGKVRFLTGPNGLTTEWRYDNLGRKIKEIRADGNETNTTYAWCDASCPQYAVYKVTSQKTGSGPVTRYMDEMNRTVRTEAIGLNGQIILKDTQHNNLGQVAAISRNYFAGSAIAWTTSEYDILNRVTKVTNPEGGIVETTYAGLTTSIRKYDLSGEYDQTISQTSNIIGQEIQVIDEAGQILTKQYNPHGNLVQTTDAGGNQVLLSYDKRGRKTAMDDPDMGHWEYKYDALGQLRWQKDAKNQVITTNYDVLGRMIQRVEPEGTTTWVYDTAGTGIGKLASVTGPGGFAQTLAYDSYGRPQADVRTISGTALSSAVAYDAFGRVERQIYPTGFEVQYSYNNNGYLTKAFNAANVNDIFWEALTSDADGNVVIFDLAGGTMTTVRVYDPLSGRMSSVSTGAGLTGSGIQFLEYDYDSLGNLRQRVSKTNPQDILTEDFGYDNQNRLINSTISGFGVKTYAYDALGNITQKGMVSDYQYGAGNAGPHAVTSAAGNTYSYDSNGNMVSGAGRTLQWTSYNKPKQISKGSTTVAFDYGPDRARFKQTKTVSGVTTTTLYFGKQFEQITKNGSTENKHYISVGGSTIAIYNKFSNGTENIRYLHKDHLGSTDAITDELGQAIERHSFDAFGARRNVNWSDPTGMLTSLETTRGFTGHEQLDEVGLVHMNGRVYDPTLGRFISADPQIQFPSQMQSFNRYSYVHNNPLSYTDPSGFGIFSKIKKAFKKLFNNKWFRLAATIVASYFTLGYTAMLTGNIYAASAAAGFAGGLVSTGTLKGALIGGVQGLAFAGVGHAKLFSSIRDVSGGGAVLHGAVGGVSSRALGGSFKEGFLSAGITKFTNTNLFKNYKGMIANTVRSAVAGGLGAKLGGGKFANGAQTGAFSYMFNDAWSDAWEETPSTSEAMCNKQEDCLQKVLYGPPREVSRYERPGSLPVLPTKGVSWLEVFASAIDGHMQLNYRVKYVDTVEYYYYDRKFNQSIVWSNGTDFVGPKNSTVWLPDPNTGMQTRVLDSRREGMVRVEDVPFDKR